jgi:hypothetical protein
MGEKPTGATQEGADPGAEGGEGDTGSGPAEGRKGTTPGTTPTHTSGA